MTVRPMAVNGMTLEPDDPTVSATIVVGPGSAPTLGENNRAYRDGDLVTVTNITVPGAGATTPDPGPYEVAFEATTQKNLSEDILLLREGDKTETVNATPKIPGSPPTDYPVSFKIEITDAGQASVFIE